MRTRQSRALNAAAYGLMAWQFGIAGSMGLLGGLWAALEGSPDVIALAPAGAVLAYIAFFAIHALKLEIESPYV